ncbi:MAG: glutamine amidotransferase family protein [Paracoccaceae bacterium]|nr:glutamine amidotransferase family protein [Paracoccaceae bacterium]
MCGIVGLFLKDTSLAPEFGTLMAAMLAQMSERGPDSAGFAVYSQTRDGGSVTLRVKTPETDLPDLDIAVGEVIGAPVSMEVRANHAVLSMPADKVEAARAAMSRLRPDASIMSWGDAIEIFKEVGQPRDVTARFDLASMEGTHGIGHTRMATESAVTTMGSHPFSTGKDQCLVHNGSLSNHNALRRKLVREGLTFETENDSEVAAAYLTWRMGQGASLGEALEQGLEDLDGFYTFVVGTKDGFGVLRDPIACKPAVLAETDRYVAFGSEYRALAGLPGIADAQVWEPEPATTYFWSR